MCIIEFMVGKEFTVLSKKCEQSSPHIVHASHGAEPKWVLHGVHRWNRFHSTIEEASGAHHMLCVSLRESPSACATEFRVKKLTIFCKIFWKFFENFKGLNETILEIYIIGWGIIADTNFQKIFRIFLENFQKILIGSIRWFQNYKYVGVL